MKSPRRASLLVASAGLAFAGLILAMLVSASKQNPDAVPTSDQVGRRVMSPFCPGLTLDECPSSQATELRQKIDKRIAAGATNQEIDSWLVADYGESVLARPPSAISWLIPAMVLLAGLAALLFALAARGKVARGKVARPSAEPVISDSPDSPARSRMLKDLSEFAKGTE